MTLVVIALLKERTFNRKAMHRYPGRINLYFDAMPSGAEPESASSRQAPLRGRTRYIPQPAHTIRGPKLSSVSSLDQRLAISTAP